MDGRDEPGTARHALRLRLLICDRGADACAGSLPEVEVGGPDATVGALRAAVARAVPGACADGRLRLLLRGRLLRDDGEALHAADTDVVSVSLWEPFGHRRKKRGGDAKMIFSGFWPEGGLFGRETLDLVFPFSRSAVVSEQRDPGSDVLSIFTDFVGYVRYGYEGIFGAREGGSDASSGKEEGGAKDGVNGPETVDERCRSFLPTWLPSPREMSALEFAVDTLRSTGIDQGDTPHVTWYTAYGCCLVATHVRVSEVSLELLGLDKWEFRVHALESEHTAAASINGSTSMFSDSVHPSQYEKLLMMLDLKVKSAQGKRDGDRSAGLSGGAGHQKTPSFIYALLCNAVADCSGEPVAKKSAPRGGTTDVGLHTGSSPRNTTWPLACAVVHRSLDGKGCGNLFDVVMPYLELWLTEGFLCQLSPRVALPRNVDLTMEMLQSSARWVSALIDMGHDVSVFELRCAVVRAELEALVEKRKLEDISKYTLSESDMRLDQQTACRNPVIRVPGVLAPVAAGSDLDHAKKQAWKNLHALPLLNTQTASWTDLLEWFKMESFSHSSASAEAIMLSLSTVESFFFRFASTLTDKALIGNADQSAATSFMSKPIEQIEAVVVAYRLRATAFRRNTPGMKVERRSLETLVIWIAFCLIHNDAKQIHPLLLDFGVAPDFRSLRHLVLSDKRAVDAVYLVSKYLQSHKSEGKELFSLRSTDDATFDFAGQAAKLSVDIQKLFRVERAAMESREIDHWNEVQDKKAQVVILWARDKQLRAELERKEAALAAEEKYEFGQYHSYNQRIRNDYKRAEKECKQWSAQVNRVGKLIVETEMSPAPILHPLPQDETLCFQVLFFLYMPPVLNSLARITVIAQQILLPCESTCCLDGTETHIDELISVQSPSTNWLDYYNTQSSGKRVKEGSTASITIHSRNGVVPRNVGPSSINGIMCTRDGVFYPDVLALPGNLGTMWCGAGFALDRRGCGYFNPYRSGNLYDRIVADSFTERLKKNDSQLQWAMPQFGFDFTDPSRGNMAIALQSTRPTWMSKTGFFGFCGLRAYPRQQLRKLCLALRERDLPLSEDSVKALFGQVLYQLGPLSLDSRENFLEWQGDRCAGIWEALEGELDALMSELRYKPREHTHFPTLSQLLSYLSQYKTSSAGLEQFLAYSARIWAESVDKELNAADNIEFRARLRAKQCLYYMYAVEGYGSIESESTAMSWENICSAMLLADSRRTLDDTSGLENSIQEASYRVSRIQTRRAWRLAAAIDADKAILTRAVQKVVQDAPDDLIWHRYVIGEYWTCCWFAVSNNQRLYSVNAIAGTLLLDGFPLQRLPAAIVSLPLYQRVFGPLTNFEVTNSSSGILKTVRPVGPRKRFYTFSLRSEGAFAGTRLVVCELADQTGDVEFELLDTSVHNWANDLPLRLTRMHSHWLCRANGLMFLRPVDYSDIGTNFLLVRDVNSEAADSWLCFRIPRHLERNDWEQATETASAFDALARLVCTAESPVVSALQKFETNRQLIHTYISQTGRLLYEMPRFDLAFAEDEDVAVDSSRNRIASLSFAGFDLCSNQQKCAGASGTLGSFTQYIVLVKRSSEVYRVIVPDGNVSLTSDAMVFIDGELRHDSKRSWHVYDVHPRFGTLAATGMLGRLQLAAIFAAIGSRLPDPSSGKTGSEFAMTLIRQCWTNCPLREDESRHLSNVAKLGRGCPGLVVLCSELAKTATSLLQLHDNAERMTLRVMDAGTAYMNEKRFASLPYRAELTSQEETSAFGRCVQRRSRRPLQSRKEVKGISDDDVKALECLHERCENELLSMVSYQRQALGGLSNSDLSVANSDTDLGKAFLGDLRESMARFASQHAPSLTCSFEEARDACKRMTSAVHKSRSAIEAAMLIILEYAGHDSGFGIARATGTCALASRTDLPWLVVDWEECLMLLNPALGDATARRLRESAFVWLKLCVLEDKLMRLTSYSPSLVPEFTQELCTQRSWDVEKHPKWLVFEAEQQICIRPIQHFIVEHLLKNPSGNMTQLNVGLGKTRVIVPMLLLHCSDAKQRQKFGAARVYFLPQLLLESYEFLHRYLTASLLNIKLYRLPFNRDVKVDSKSDLVAQMWESLSCCQESGGALVLAPQERLSLVLKTTEARLANADKLTTDRLERMVKDDFWMDLMDESDEILRHTNQLVYAMGASTSLPQGEVRWRCAHAVLEVLRSESVSVLLSDDRIARVTPSKAPGSMTNILLIGGSELTERWPAIMQHIAERVIHQKMQWVADTKWRRQVLHFVCDASIGLDEWTKEVGVLTVRRRHQVLALRAMLAYGHLEHCLSKRHRVAYGVDRRRGSKRRIAVPFRYSDTPSERSEFAHPDAEIMYTTLSYLYDGLSHVELREALSLLSKMGTNARQQEYNSWLELSRGQLSPQHVLPIDSELKLDPTSKVQFELLHMAFRSNFRTVSFFLRKCVFPRETMTFQQQLRATGWRLSDNRHTVGFSGTDDSKRLLPLHVEQTQPDIDELVATNGQMVARICESDVDSGWDVGAIRADDDPVWRALIKHSVGRGAAALIDCGALLTGIRMEDAAEYATSLLVDSNFKGVVYYSGSKEWTVCSLDRQKWPLNRSPIHESDAFVMFDESHCRGADMKLKRHAIAVVSLGMNVCKDKLIQAVGRMRQLGPGRQTVRLAVPQEVQVQLQSASLECSAVGILSWCISNSISACANGLTQWSSQGMHYHRVKANPDDACEDVVLDLESMYKHAMTSVPVAAAADAERECWRENQAASEPYANNVDKIMERVEAIGAGFSVCASQGMGEECERELENEREAEEEVQVAVTAASPVKEIDWDCNVLLEAGILGVSELQETCPVLPLQHFVVQRLKLPGFDEYSFPGIYATRNFVETVCVRGDAMTLRDYLRPVDAGLLYANGDVLLLSEREADLVLESIWALGGSCSSTGPSFINHSYVRVCLSGDSIALSLPIRISEDNRSLTILRHSTIAALQLFNGDTMFRDENGQAMSARMSAVRNLLSAGQSGNSALMLTTLRGKNIHVEGSDLQSLTTEDRLTLDTTLDTN